MSPAPADASEQSPKAKPLSSSANARKESADIMNVAVLGDSQSTGGYGNRLSELIRFASKQRLVYFAAASSSRISGWLNGGFTPIPSNGYFGCDSGSAQRSCTPTLQAGRKTEAIATILANHPAVDLYLVTLGDNHFFDPASVNSELPRLIKTILGSGAKCAFVTPTEGLGQFANKLTLIANLKSAVNSVKSEIGKTCTLIDSYTVGGDVLRTDEDLYVMRSAVLADPMRLHPQGVGARLWAERVFDALLKNELLTRQ